MPRASAGAVAAVKYHFQDEDSDYLIQAPPVQNQWYTVFDAVDVRLLVCAIVQNNDDVAAKDLEIRWTIDGNVYFMADTFGQGILEYIYRRYAPSTGGTDGLHDTSAVQGAAIHAAKNGLAFKVEVRMTSVPGTNQQLRCWCVRETLVEA